MNTETLHRSAMMAALLLAGIGSPAAIGQVSSSPRKSAAKIVVRMGELFLTDVALEAPTLSMPL